MGDSADALTLLCASCGRGTDTVPCASCGGNPLLQDRYRLTHPIPGAGPATVYTASDVRTGGTRVQVRVLPLRPKAVDLVRQWLPRWAEAVRAARHHTVRGWHDAFLVSAGGAGALGVVQLPSPWPTLESSQASPWSVARTRIWMEHLLEGLQRLHGAETPISCGPLNRSRVAVSEDGGPVVLHPVDIEQYAAFTVADPAMPPELRSGPWVPGSDLHRVAALSVCLLSGRSVQQLWTPHGEPDWQRFVDVPDGLTALLERWLSPEPSARPPTAAAALQQLRRLGPGPTTAGAQPREAAFGEVPVGVAAVRVPAWLEPDSLSDAPAFGARRAPGRRPRLSAVDSVPTQPMRTGVPSHRLRWLIVPILLALIIAAVLSLQMALTATGWLPGRPVISLQRPSLESP
ncbi:MAG: hypothetical protein CL927_19005 [Deltaproteobacteria bacterium]|nr:hypothetical protein [Deltaproteobacteria bacterium]HCH64739.1 hypothetical protein [Deltaproteobacteria bacterium]